MSLEKQVEKTAVAIIGAGPIGLECAIALQRQGVPNIIFEAQQVGDAFTHWPPHTRFFSTPEHVAIAGVPVHSVDQQPVTGEEYLAYLRLVVEMFAVDVRVYEPVTAVAPTTPGFHITTQTRTGPRHYQCDYVIFATGGMARPRLLHIPGEELPHVSHYFPDPHRYFRTKLLIVGGKNSAAEAALRCWRAGVHVSLSYRRPWFDPDRIKPHMRDDLKDRIERGEITYYPSTVPMEITPTQVVLASTKEDLSPNGHITKVEADFVLLATGFVADMSLLAQAGVQLEDREYCSDAPVHNPETMETTVPGIFVAGTAVGGTQHRVRHFISTSHDDVIRIVRAITGQTPKQVGTVEARNNAVTWREVMAN
ncbi:MAG: NAD(P)-binding domain-containing protein [Ardenticatenaceae bacterium]|nr:NAD(P)-binding domain-containing protein [Ardenticatenaceae bacterium]